MKINNPHKINSACEIIAHMIYVALDEIDVVACAIILTQTEQRIHVNAMTLSTLLPR